MSVQLRPYQVEAVQSIYDYFANNTGNPLIVLPTGAGKSLTMAAFIQGAIAQYPQTRVVVLTHVKELIKQDAQAIIRYWPKAPVGIWSAGLGQRQIDQVTVAGIQSVHNRPAKFAETDLVIIDEAHLLSRRSESMYGRFLESLRGYNPALKVIGLTATPYRMDSGWLTEGDSRVFTDVCYEAEVGNLIKDGYLCPLVAKSGATKADLSAVHTRGGEFVAGELQDAMNIDSLIVGALDEIDRFASDRNHILGFCAGISHAQNCAVIARSRGVKADYVSGEMDAGDRDKRIAAFTSGETRMLFNAMLLTTGFDYPSIDCIVMMRPTKSVGLYVQIMGRGLRKDGVKDNTLVLDFSGNIMRHGPIDQVRAPKKAGESDGLGVAPMKECPSCNALVPTSVMVCPFCDHLWPKAPSHGVEAADLVVVAATEPPRAYEVWRVEYSRHQKQDKPPSVKVTYLCGISEFTEWIPLEDPRSFVRKHAVTWCWKRGLVCPETVDEFLKMVTESRVPAPDSITVKPDGRYWRVVSADMGASRTNVSKVIHGRVFSNA